MLMQVVTLFFLRDLRWFMRKTYSLIRYPSTRAFVHVLGEDGLVPCCQYKNTLVQGTWYLSNRIQLILDPLCRDFSLFI